MRNFIGKTIDGWFDRVNQEQRERAINQIYDIFAAAGYGNIADGGELDGFAAENVAAARGTDVERASSSKMCSRRFRPAQRKSLSVNCATTRRGMRDGQHY